MPPPRSTAFTFATDWWDEGIPTVLEGLAGRAGVTGCTIAVAYHAARDLLPHNPRRRVAFVESGVVYFQPQLDRYTATPLRPMLAASAMGRDVLRDVAPAATGRGLEVGAWTVFSHNSRLAGEHPELAVRNAFGDPMLSYLCPTQRNVHDFFVALAGDIARYQPGAVHLESLSFMPYDHGGHHERTFLPLDALSRYFLGLCFCDACVAGASDQGVDMGRVCEVVRSHLEGAFLGDVPTGQPGVIERGALEAMAAGHVGRFIAVRQSIVTALVRDVAARIREESPATRIVFLDVSGAFASTMPEPVRAVDLAWRDGLDLTALARIVSTIGICAYFADLARLRREVGAYRDLVPEAELEIVLRPAWPDALSADQLAARIAAIAGAKTRYGFYNYGMTRLDALDSIKYALSMPALLHA